MMDSVADILAHDQLLLGTMHSSEAGFWYQFLGYLAMFFQENMPETEKKREGRRRRRRNANCNLAEPSK
jgi:hypothetical protein